MHVSCAAGTDKGVVRSANEDYHLMQLDRGIFIVADGMGGHAAGEVASEMAVRIIADEMGREAAVGSNETGTKVSEGIVAALGTALDAEFTANDVVKVGARARDDADDKGSSVASGCGRVVWTSVGPFMGGRG